MAYPGREATPGTILAFGALLCLVLVNVSVPITPGIYFLNIVDSQNEDYFRIGLWDENDFPFGEKLGIFDKTIGSAIGILFLTHAVAGAATLIMTIMGCIGHFRSQRNGRILIKTTIVSLAAIIITLLAFIFDVIFFIVGKVTIDKNSEAHASASLASAFWMMVAALTLEAVAILAFFVGHRTIVTRMKKAEEIKHKPEMSGEAYLEQKQEEEEEIKIENANRPIEHRPLPIPPISNPHSLAGTVPITPNEKYGSAFPPPVPSIPPQYYQGSSTPYTSPPFGPTISGSSTPYTSPPFEHSYFNSSRSSSSRSRGDSDIHTRSPPAPYYYSSQQGQGFDPHSRSMSETTSQRQQTSDHEKGHTTGW
ncbi:6463_t:CDS:2 [Ambispora gerdemannii]|uniref:6463_t:CDS:1 n=1 Tax=Ambispora gerdemannii TaxID=144530 RepID=A0A9N9GHH6_9GLOM|nr:6463_t:CDS:2 [Ambispora gerdemannii]